MNIRILELKEIEDIYKHQMQNDFPPEERKPLERINMLILENRYECVGAFENEELLAYAFVVKNNKDTEILVDYLAVSKENRGQGIGSFMLEELKKKYSEYEGILIESERVDKADSSITREIRSNRIAFYKKNGFYNTGVSTKLYNVFYNILYYSNKYSNPQQKISNSQIREKLEEIYHVLFTEEIYKEKVSYVYQNILLVAINAKYIHSNLAVYTLKKNSDEYSNYVSIAEYTINQYVADIVTDIYKKKPDVIAFSCYIWNREHVCKVIGELSKILPDVPIYVGGPEVSYSAKEFLMAYPQVYGVMCSEGEKIFKNMLKHWVDNQLSLEDIKGIVYRDESNNIQINQMEEPLDLSTLKFPYDNLEAFKNKIIYYESSRGCPFSCSYCLSSIDKKLRFRDVEMVKKELQFFIDNQVKQVKFVDRTFNCNKKHAMEIWQYIYEHDNGITNFHFEISADLIDEEELALFEKMRPQLVQFEIGIQSTNQKTIKEIDRTMNISKLKKVVNRINSFSNIHQHLDLIAGLPFEDYDSFINSFNEVYEMKPEQLQLGFLKVLSGAKMHWKAEDYGLVYTSLPPYEVLYTKWLTFDEVLKLKSIENMVEIYYNSRQFTTILTYLEKKFESSFKLYEELGNYFEKAGYNEAKHTRIAFYEILLEFIHKKSFNVSICSELLTYDVYLRENIKTRPEFSNDINKEKDMLRPFYKDYKDLGKQIHIEHFHYDIIKFIETGELVNQDTIILFDYRERNKITSQVKTRRI